MKDKDYYVRRDLVNEQVNHKENIYVERDDRKRIAREVIVESTFIEDNSHQTEVKKNDIPENYLG